ncbi:MAG: hypothetical protein EAZ39_28825 [Oscillatoriales cyanobacterium]|nr:MAG: hypothetical protein EAZ39_28825 [Oscillatoriales cyanobacterium]
MVEWAPCLDEYEPETIETSSITLEIPSMLIISEGCANESCKCWNFSIPGFSLAGLCQNPPVFRRWLSLRAIGQTALKSSPAAQHF